MPATVRRPRHARDEAVPRRELRPGRRHHPRRRTRRKRSALANDSDYGLSASVFTRDTARGLRVARAIRLRHLPRQRPDRARRGADAVRRRQALGLRPLRRQGRDRRLHRAALDHHRRRAAATIRSERQRPSPARCAGAGRGSDEGPSITGQPLLQSMRSISIMRRVLMSSLGLDARLRDIDRVIRDPVVSGARR